jgi:hypothetical protein
MSAASNTKARNQAAEVVRMPLIEPVAHNGVWAFYAVLAYPWRKDRKKRRQFVVAMKAAKYKRDLKQGLDRRNLPKAYKIKNEKIVGQMNRGFRSAPSIPTFRRSTRSKPEYSRISVMV